MNGKSVFLLGSATLLALGGFWLGPLTATSNDGAPLGLLTPELRDALSPMQKQLLTELYEVHRTQPDAAPSHVCFSADTNPLVVEAFSTVLYGPAGEQFDQSDRWFSTATDGSGLGSGDPTTLTWGILPDGVNSFYFDDGTTRPSDLIGTLDNLYGAGPGGADLTQRPWFPLLQMSLDDWAEFSGIQYVYEPNDDGASFPSSPGALGVRPDVRVGGRLLDGQGPGTGVLGFGYFPDTGDIVLDTGNTSFLANTSNNSRGLRNLLAHEGGHGLGFGHSCPPDQSKLMEPVIALNFDGPQHDDYRAVNQGYGDANEFPQENDSANQATDLGFLADADTLLLRNLSIDDSPDKDFLAFTVAARMRITLNLAPVGSVYWNSDEIGPNNCPLGFFVNSQNRNDLGMSIRGLSGNNILAAASAKPSGLPETITDFLLEEGPGTYFVNVFGDTNEVQLYDLEIIASEGQAPVALCKDISSCGSNVNTNRFNNGSFDPDGDAITITVNPLGPYPPGETVVELVVSDGALFDTCQATVTVNRPPVAAAQDMLIEVDGGPSCMGSVAPDSLDAGSTDPDGDDLTLELDPPGPYAEGVTPVNLIVTDRCGVSDTATAMVTVDCMVPVELLSFQALREGEVTVVTWEVAEAWDHAGFHVFREEGGERNQLTEGLLQGETRYRYEDVSAPMGSVRYWLQELSRSGETSWHGPVTVRMSAAPVLMLSHARPNPFTGSTTLRYAVPNSGPVELVIFDTRGRRVKTLVQSTPGAGEYEVTWSGDTDGGRRAPAGLYFVRLRGGVETRLQKIVFVP